MREIKFRAFNRATETMHYADLKEVAKRIELPEMVVMQYTGLKDKNGKEIYEGDIVKTHCFYQGLGENLGVIECEKEFISIVEYYQNDCAFVLTHTKDGDIYNFAQIEEPTEELEVIGNIYENENLIKGE